MRPKPSKLVPFRLLSAEPHVGTGDGGTGEGGSTGGGSVSVLEVVEDDQVSRVQAWVGSDRASEASSSAGEAVGARPVPSGPGCSGGLDVQVSLCPPRQPEKPRLAIAGPVAMPPPRCAGLSAPGMTPCHEVEVAGCGP